MRGVWRAQRLWNNLVAHARLARAKKRVAAFPLVRPIQHPLPGELIVSLTSYKARFETLALTLRSLLDQTVAADRTILWLTPEDRVQLPADVHALVHHGLEIRECDDWKSYKKLVPSLIAFPDAYIVTADDDLYYDPAWLADLVKESLRWPSHVLSHRAHLALRTNQGEFLPYGQWQFETRERCHSSDQAVLFPTGGAGALYPPHALHPLATNAALFQRLCPNADDIWFFWMAMIAGTPHRRTKRRRSLVCWQGSQEVGLVHINLWGGGNDRQIAAMERHFGELRASRIA